MTFDYLNVKNSEELKNMTDFELVKLSQKDIDEYRADTYWECKECGCKISYKNSLLLTDSIYVNEMRCPNILKTKKTYYKCNKKMDLIKPDGSFLDSLYFNEIFARYQDKIIQKCNKGSYIKDPSDLYCDILLSFIKIVGQFDRDNTRKRKSQKWFSSFFWTSINNKMSDIIKTENYNKRSPTLKCPICGRIVNRITKNHLTEQGHDEIWDKVYLDMGYFLCPRYQHMDKKYNEYEKMCFENGKEYYTDKNKEFEEECLVKYFADHNGYNNIISINEFLDYDENKDFLDVELEPVYPTIDNNNDTSTKEIKSIINEIIKNIKDEDFIDLSVFFDTNNIETIRKISREALLEKYINYKDETDFYEGKKIDKILDVSVGFTTALINKIRAIKSCKKVLT